MGKFRFLCIGVKMWQWSIFKLFYMSKSNDINKTYLLHFLENGLLHESEWVIMP